AALIGAAGWITLANWARAPVSTTHSVIGAVAGAGLMAMGVAAVNWPMIAQIALAWIMAPVITAAQAALLLGFMRWRLHFVPDRGRAARLWLPLMIGAMALIFALYLTRLVTGAPLGRAGLALSAGLGLAAWALIRLQLEREIRRDGHEKLSLKRLLSGPLVVTALLSGFAHGANDVANIAGPLSVLQGGAGGAVSLQVIGLGAAAIAIGSFVFGRRLVRMVGMSITRLNPVRAFCAALAGASSVLAFSALGLPVSTTHCAVGGIFGVGFYREWEDRFRRKSRKSLPPEEIFRRQLVRRSHVWTTLAAWAVTVPGAGIMAALSFGLIRVAF
ncbi:MAG: anion permease, partial [Paracoccus sp. (in: a-proteobacteria)]|nr:anion permease [Paracoccus sp. (in: a-proteobacteria)]